MMKMCNICKNNFAEICGEGLCPDCNELLHIVYENYEDLLCVINNALFYYSRFQNDCTISTIDHKYQEISVFTIQRGTKNMFKM